MYSFVTFERNVNFVYFSSAAENNRADQTTSVIKYLKGDMTTDHGQVPVIDFCTKAFLQQQPLGGVH